MTLGLLAVSWLLLALLIGMDPRSSRTASLIPNVLVWLILTGPHVLFALATERGGHIPEIATTCIPVALIYLVISLLLGVAWIADGMRSHTSGALGMIAALFWFVGWPLGIVTHARARNLSRNSNR